jgi:hypothetical protein
MWPLHLYLLHVECPHQARLCGLGLSMRWGLQVVGRVRQADDVQGAPTRPCQLITAAHRCRRVLGAAEGDVTGAGAGAKQVGLHMGRQDGAYRPKGLVQQQGRGLKGGGQQSKGGGTWMCQYTGCCGCKQVGDNWTGGGCSALRRGRRADHTLCRHSTCGTYLSGSSPRQESQR